MAASPNSHVLEHQRFVDDAVLAYVGWRRECTEVWDTYRYWTNATAADAAAAWCAYRNAVDREEAAAAVYATLMDRVGGLVETGLDYPLG